MAKQRKSSGGGGGGGGGALNLTAIKSAVAKQGAGWEAGATTLTALPAAERAGFLGLVVSKEELSAAKTAIAAAESLAAFRAVAAPPAVDWRNNGGNFVTPIKNQQSCGSCVSFGTLATIESRMNKVCNTPGTNRDYSEALLFYCGCSNCCVPGWNFVPALDFCKNTGVALETAWPYTPGNQPCKPAVPVEFKISGHTTALSMADRKTAIADRGPVVAGMAVYQDFYAYTSGVYKHVSGTFAGYHAVSVIGYDDGKSCWIAKNSWGAGWGESGFFKIGYGEAQMDTSFPFYEPQVVCGPPKVLCDSYLPALRRVILLARQDAALRNCLRRRICSPRPGTLCPPRYLAIVNAVAAILKRCPQYRAPFCRAIG